jgi:hypothetical protein
MNECMKVTLLSFFVSFYTCKVLYLPSDPKKKGWLKKKKLMVINYMKIGSQQRVCIFRRWMREALRSLVDLLFDFLRKADELRYGSICRTRWPNGLRRSISWHCGFESHRGHDYLSLVSVMCCQVEVPEIGWSLVQRSRNECGVSERNRKASIMKRPWLTRGYFTMEKMDKFKRQ